MNGKVVTLLKLFLDAITKLENIKLLYPEMHTYASIILYKESQYVTPQPEICFKYR